MTPMLGLILALAARADWMPAAEQRPYVGFSRAAPVELGELQLSLTAAKFSRLRGQMILRLVPGGAEGRAVFDVVNAEQFDRQNRSRKLPCASPVRQIAVSPAQRGMIWIEFFEGGPKRVSDNPCRADTFVAS